MKTIFRFFALGLLVATIGTSCKSTKPIEKVNGEEEVATPFSNFTTDKHYIRAVASGYSPDMNVAKKMAINNAKSEMAGQIQSLFQEVTTQYMQQYGQNAKPDLQQKFESMSQTVTSQALTNVMVKDSKTFKDKTTNDYRCWAAIEMSKEDIGKDLMKRISQETKERIDLNQEKYQQVFEKALNDYNGK